VVPTFGRLAQSYSFEKNNLCNLFSMWQL